MNIIDFKSHKKVTKNTNFNHKAILRMKENIELMRHRITQDIFTIACRERKLTDADVSIFKNVVTIIKNQEDLIKKI